jgi:hypothetical protein
MFLATLARSASSAERSSVLRADRRRLRALDERLGGSANGRGRSTGWRGVGLFDADLREFSERADRVGAGLRDGRDGGERRLSDGMRFDVELRKLRNKRRLRERRDLFGRLRSLRRYGDDLRRNGV